MSKRDDKLSWKTRMRLCWEVFTRGKYDPRDYRTIQEQGQWERCEQMRKDLASSCRPRVPFSDRNDTMEQ